MKIRRKFRKLPLYIECAQVVVFFLYSFDMCLTRAFISCFSSRTHSFADDFYVSQNIRLFVRFRTLQSNTYNLITCSPNKSYCFNEKQFVEMSYLNWSSQLSAFAFMLQTLQTLITQMRCALLFSQRENNIYGCVYV